MGDHRHLAFRNEAKPVGYALARHFSFFPSEIQAAKCSFFAFTLSNLQILTRKGNHRATRMALLMSKSSKDREKEGVEKVLALQSALVE